MFDKHPTISVLPAPRGAEMERGRAGFKPAPTFGQPRSNLSPLISHLSFLCLYLPLYTGSLFSRKALVASAKSSVVVAIP